MPRSWTGTTDGCSSTPCTRASRKKRVTSTSLRSAPRISFTATFFNQAGALVHVFTDGSVQVKHGGTEMGQGLHTKVMQVVADELGVPFERVRCTATETGKVPNASATATVRSVFIIDPNKVVRATITYPASTGRNFDEILRVIDSLQLTDSHKVATPANWRDGDDVVILPSLQDPQELAERFPKGYTAVRPYLRITPQPNR